ncbi:MAG TPA: mechanosensitive ion channel family protein [Candidatus Woesearchaeota archaeon]|nr:mechanosensitive ion channel family protein [Candidatus Woesearchaeota archaeon]
MSLLFVSMSQGLENLKLFFTGQGFIATLFFLLIFFSGYLFTKLVVSYLKIMSLRTATPADDIFARRFKSSSMGFFFVLAAMMFLNYSGLHLEIINKVVMVLFIFVTFDAVSKLFDFFIEHWSNLISRKLIAAEEEVKSVSQSFSPLFHRLSRITFLIIAIIVVMVNLGVDVRPILGGLGIAGLAISLAAKDSLSNIFGGIALTADKVFKVGDMVNLPSKSIMGIVYDVGLRSTRIKTWDNEVFIIPNGILANEVIQNYYQPDMKSRAVVPFSVEYGSDIDQVKKVVLGEIKKIKKALKDPEPSVVFNSMSDFSLDFDARFWLESIRDRYLSRLELTERIYKALNREGIGIPFPTRTLYMKEEKAKRKRTAKKKPVVKAKPTKKPTAKKSARKKPR